MDASDYAIVFIGGLFNVLKTRTNRGSLVYAANWQEAIALSEKRVVKAVIVMLNDHNLEEAKLARQVNNPPRLLFFETFGNVPLIRRKLDQAGFESSGVTTTRFLMKYAEDILDSLMEERENANSCDILAARATELPLPRLAFLSWLRGQVEAASCLTWEEIEGLLANRLRSPGLSLQLVRRTKSREIDIVGLSDYSGEDRCLLQVSRRLSSFAIEPVQSVSFFQGRGTRSCLAMVSASGREDCSSQHSWRLDVWDYEELKDWVLRQGWWST